MEGRVVGMVIGRLFPLEYHQDPLRTQFGIDRTTGVRSTAYTVTIADLVIFRASEPSIRFNS